MIAFLQCLQKVRHFKMVMQYLCKYQIHGSNENKETEIDKDSVFKL